MEAQVAPPVSHETVVRWGGRVLVLQRADNETGFLNVNKQKDRKRTKPCYAKYKPRARRGVPAHADWLVLGDGMGSSSQAGLPPRGPAAASSKSSPCIPALERGEPP